MLVLTRRDGQGVQIGEDVFVYLLRGQDGEARVGIEAPRNVNIARVEQPAHTERHKAGGRR